MISPKQRGEIESRQFLGDEVWKEWKLDYDQCMAFRKSIKGKPTEEQMALIKMNAAFIDFYNSVLFHSPTLAKWGKCVCQRCVKSIKT